MPVELLQDRVNVFDLKLETQERLLGLEDILGDTEVVRRKLIEYVSQPFNQQADMYDYIRKAYTAVTLKTLFPESLDQVDLSQFRQNIINYIGVSRRSYQNSAHHGPTSYSDYLDNWAQSFQITKALFPDSQEIASNEYQLKSVLSTRWDVLRGRPIQDFANIYYYLFYPYFLKVLFGKEDLFRNQEEENKLKEDALKGIGDSLGNSPLVGGVFEYKSILLHLKRFRVLFPDISTYDIISSDHWDRIKYLKNINENDAVVGPLYSYFDLVEHMALVFAPKIKIKDGLVLPDFDQGFETPEKPLPERRKY